MSPCIVNLNPLFHPVRIWRTLLVPIHLRIESQSLVCNQSLTTAMGGVQNYNKLACPLFPMSPYTLQFLFYQMSIFQVWHRILLSNHIPSSYKNQSRNPACAAGLREFSMSQDSLSFIPKIVHPHSLRQSELSIVKIRPFP